MTNRISIVTPTLNEVDNVEACRDAVARVFAEQLPQFEYEHIFTDNASTDGTADKLRQMAAESTRIKVIFNSRDFGSEASMLNAVRRATGDAVVVMLPADLQDPPELIPEFVRLWQQGYKVVYGIRRARRENALVLLLRKTFYRVVNRLSEFDIPRDVGEFQLIDRQVADVLKRFEDTKPFLRGMIASCGFRSTGVEYQFRRRQRGRSNMTMGGLVGMGLNGVISFSSAPIRVATAAGLVIAVVSILYSAASLVISAIYYRELAPPGIPTLIVALFFFGGVQLFFLGILGEYVLAIHGQVRRRPLVIEAETINFDPEPDKDTR